MKDLTHAPARRAPAFTLPNAQGEPTTLASLLQTGPCVVYFYPKNDTPGCTKEACHFRDAFAAFQEHGCQVAGISRDGAASHARFAARHELPFVLLTDEGGAVAHAWGIKKTLGLLAGRETFLVDADGFIRHHVSGQFGVERHVQETLAALAQLGR